MSIWVVGGVAMGCWAMLSILSGERYRQKLEIEAAKKAQERALLEAQAAENAGPEAAHH